MHLHSDIPNNIIGNVIGCLDGFVLRMKRPREKNCKFPMRFFDQHKKTFGIKVLILVNADFEITFLDVDRPAPTGDQTAFKESDLFYYLFGLPATFVVLADGAFMDMEIMNEHDD
eukprot:Nk52_evm1s2147 gene=Nk52_evmTU1s2147